jgi:hypothetical protein
MTYSPSTTVSIRWFDLVLDLGNPRAGLDKARALEWNQAERVGFAIILKRNGRRHAIPAGSTVSLSVWDPADLTELLIDAKAGTIEDAAEGELEIILAPTDTNLGVGTYAGNIVVKNGSTQIGVLPLPTITVAFSSESADYPAVAATPSSALQSSPASLMARRVTPSIISTWLRAAISGTTPALSPANASIQTWTLSGNSTPTAGTWLAGQSITLMVDDGSASTITWTSLPVTWKTDFGTAPTLETSGITAIALWKVGTTIYGARVGNA